jgi:hypothetical protein
MISVCLAKSLMENTLPPDAINKALVRERSIIR